MVWVAIFNAGLTACLLFLSMHVEGLWWLGWIACAPLLRLTFGDMPSWTLGGAALASGALAALLTVWPWIAVLTGPMLAALMALNAVAFLTAAMLSRLVGRALSPLAGPPMFGALWAFWDYVAASGPDGLIASPATSQVPVPLFIQTAALAGPWPITFALGTVAGYVALAFGRRETQYLLPAAFLFLANALAGTLFPVAGGGAEREITLISSDRLAEAAVADREDLALGAVLAYAAEVRVKASGSGLAVLPEKIAVLRPPWRDLAIAELQGAARASGATIVAGFEERGNGLPRNVALTVLPDGRTLRDEQGAASLAHNGIAIGHEVNFPDDMRARAIRGHAGLLIVPAWDFGATDGVMQAHAAILTAVENGMALARTGRDGRLTLADAAGDVVVGRGSGGDGFVATRRNLAAGAAPGTTLYDRTGDVSVDFLGGLAVLLLLTAALRHWLTSGWAADSDLRELMWDRIAAPYAPGE